MQEPQWIEAAFAAAHPAGEPCIEQSAPPGERKGTWLLGVDIESLSLENILASLEGRFDPEVVALAKEYLAKAEVELAEQGN